MLHTITPAAPEEEATFGQVVSLSSDGSVLGIGIPGATVNTLLYAGKAKVYQDCSLSKISVSAEQPEAFCSGNNTLLTAAVSPGYYATNGTANWYDAEDATEPIFTGMEFETPELSETTSYWVEAVTATGCTSEREEVVVTVNPIPELIIENTEIETCEGTSATLTVTSDGTINWYDSQDATEPVFTGNTFTTPPLTNSTTYYVEAQSGDCTTERQEITVTVLPAPVLEVENTDVQVCSGNDAYLYAFSEGNVIFWYTNEDDTEYVYHGNNFIIEGLTGSISYWVEAYNLATGCRSERVEVTVTVNPVPEAPVAVEIQQAEEGWTLADLEVIADGDLTWYADEALTIVLPETTLVEDDTTYWVTQTINGCESAATGVFVEQLGTSDINNAEFVYWPNPVKDKLYFDGKETVQSVQVFDMSGRLLMNRQSATGLTQLDVTVLSKGTYIVKAQTDKEVKTFKIIK